jgi:signal transduction histidine kinase
MSLINDLLDLEKLESGTILISFAPCDLAAIFADSFNAVKVFAQERSVTVRMPERCQVECTADANRIVQVLVNLISNAVKFSPPDSTVSVEFEEMEKWLKIKVIDQGRGIPPRFREAIFERFQQVEAADAQKKGGTGLGLAICKAIVEQHGGTIGVDSVEGEGSTFWFTLPYESDDDDLGYNGDTG